MPVFKGFFELTFFSRNTPKMAVRVFGILEREKGFRGVSCLI